MVLAGGHSCYRKFKFKFYIYSSSIKTIFLDLVDNLNPNLDVKHRQQL